MGVAMADETIDKLSSKSRRLANLTGGSRKGIPNKATKALKEMILGALDDAGGQEWLAKQAAEQPAAFMTLIGKVLPTTIAGDKDNPLEFRQAAPEELTARIVGLIEQTRGALECPKDSPTQEETV